MANQQQLANQGNHNRNSTPACPNTQQQPPSYYRTTPSGPTYYPIMPSGPTYYTSPKKRP
jgi:hypothetical protein